MSATSIQWTDAVWNPVRGCSLVSAGCTNCYAMKQAHRFSGAGMPYHGLTKMTAHGPVWTGRARAVPEMLDKPLRWRKPARIFVNSMSDLFHESVSFEFISAVFGIMAMSQRHTFQVLTKRPARALEWAEWIENDADGPTWGCILHAREIAGMLRTIAKEPIDDGPRWPLPNVWLGVSVEDQATADERIRLLLRAPAAVRFLSCEPLLGPVDLKWLRIAWQCSGCRTYFAGRYQRVCPDCGRECYWSGSHAFNGTKGPFPSQIGSGLNWVIVGGESGPGARPFDIAWARSIRDQCQAAGVPVFVKQMGGQVRVPRSDAIQFAAKGSWRADGPAAPYGVAKTFDRAGGDMLEWPPDLRVREFPP